MTLQRSSEQLGDDVTLLYDCFLPSSMIKICENHGKEKGGPWECYKTGWYDNAPSWRDKRVVAVTTGREAYICANRDPQVSSNYPLPPILSLLDGASRAKTKLVLILAESKKQEYQNCYTRLKKNIKAAAVKGLVDVEVIESENQIENENLQDTDAATDQEGTQNDVNSNYNNDTDNVQELGRRENVGRYWRQGPGASHENQNRNDPNGFGKIYKAQYSSTEEHHNDAAADHEKTQTDADYNNDDDELVDLEVTESKNTNKIGHRCNMM